MKKTNFAILGPGTIANKMAETVTKMDEINCYAVASRNIERAQEFADNMGIRKGIWII